MKLLHGACAALLAGLLAAGCSPQPGEDSVADGGHGSTALVRADRLLFDEQQPGVEAYPLRVLVTAAHVRIDDNVDDGDYLLYARAAGTIYNVTHEDRTVLEMNSAPSVPVIPEDLRIEVIGSIDEQAPAVAGRQPEQATLSVNGAPCYRLIQVPGLLEAGLAGVAEYARALGNRQLAQLDTLLPEQGTPCFLARYVYAADRPWTGGIPLEQWDDAGYRRTLVDFSAQEEFSAELFRLPADYSVYRLEASDR